MKQRESEILDIVTVLKSVEVSKLAEMLGVSAVTVRKALDSLESKRLVRREHGLALAVSSDDIGSRLAIHYEVKQRIAARAAEMVSDWEAVMIESGSCCALLAEAILKERSNITIITNSAFIADHVRRIPAGRVVLLGGEYQKEAQVNVGALVRRCAASFYVDKLFIGTDGFTPEAGFTGRDLARAEAVLDLAERADHVIVLTDSEKFGRHGPVSLVGAGSVAAVVTDEGIPPECEEALERSGARVVKAGPAPARA